MAISSAVAQSAAEICAAVAFIAPASFFQPVGRG